MDANGFTLVSHKHKNKALFASRRHTNVNVYEDLQSNGSDEEFTSTSRIVTNSDKVNIEVEQGVPSTLQS